MKMEKSVLIEVYSIDLDLSTCIEWCRTNQNNILRSEQAVLQRKVIYCGRK